MIRTARAYSPTRERLLDADQDLILAQGFSATAVDAICEKAKLTKGSFFHYFDSKEQLGRVLLERFCADGHRLHAGLCGVERDPLKRIDNYLNGLIKLARDPQMSKGCLLGTFAQELCDEYPEIRRMCERGFQNWAAQFGEELAKAKARHAPKAAFDPEELAEHLIAIMEGSLILGKAKHTTTTLEQNLRHFRRYLHLLFAR